VSSGRPEEYRQKMHTLILKLLDDCGELSTKGLYSILKTIEKHLERRYEDLAHYFNAIQQIYRTEDNRLITLFYSSDATAYDMPLDD
jgi:predicted solute-binding protein